MSRARAVPLAITAILLHAVAREADRGLCLLLRAQVEPLGLLRELGRACAADGAGAALRLGAWTAAGLALWLALAARRSRRERASLASGLVAEAPALAPLLLKPALSLLAVLAVAARASWPYGFTLPVALTQDWAIGVDLAILGALAASCLAAPRWPAPRAGEVLLLAFLGYAALVPEWAWRWEGHPGNEPKYLRQAVALGQLGSFDAEGVRAAMEELPVRPLGETLTAAAATFARESAAMVSAVARGEAGRSAIRATRITRQTIRGKDGGVFYVLAPGPSLLLAPALRLDRAVNLTRGEEGRVAAAVLLWCALGALLVAALFQLVRDATGRPGLAAALAFGFALTPPFLFYFFQFYPEMPGALVLAVAFRVLALRPQALERHPWLFGWLLATLPWLHQKFLPVWLVLAATALWLAVWPRGLRAARASVVALLVTQAVGLYLTALYNFAVTGSVRPDALFLAWGPGGVSTARMGQGLLGLLLDARFGLLPYVPFLALAAVGLARGGARRFAVAWPAAAVYYLTVASADNWAGAVCNLGRYFMPLAPLTVALAAVALARETAATETEGHRRGAVALALILAGATAVCAVLLWQDPLAANDSALLLARSRFADANQYLPNLFIRRWQDAAPGLWPRIAAWALGVGLLAFALRRVGSARRALASTALVVLALALVLERWPSRRSGPAFVDALPAGEGRLVFFSGVARVAADEAVLGPGAVDLLVRSPGAGGTALRATVGGEGLLRNGSQAIVLRPTGGVVDLALVAYHQVAAADGGGVAYCRASLALSGQAVIRFAAEASRSVAAPDPPAPGEPDEDVEPGDPGLR